MNILDSKEYFQALSHATALLITQDMSSLFKPFLEYHLVAIQGKIVHNKQGYRIIHDCNGCPPRFLDGSFSYIFIYYSEIRSNFKEFFSQCDPLLIHGGI